MCASWPSRNPCALLQRAQSLESCTMPQFSRSLSAALVGSVVATVASTASADLIAGWSMPCRFPVGTGNVPTGNSFLVPLAVNPDGTLVFSAGSIAIHAIALDFVSRITDEGLDLPFHLARKKLAVLPDLTTPEAIEWSKPLPPEQWAKRSPELAQAIAKREAELAAPDKAA